MIMIWVMDKRDIVDGALRAAAFAVKHKPPTVTDTIPTVDDLITQLQAESPEDFPQPGLGEIPQPVPQEIKEKIATACIPCSLSHLATSSGLLNEALRFKNEGITSNEVVDRIAQALVEHNAMERVDLAVEKIYKLPEWEKCIAEEALENSRRIRHQLVDIKTVGDLERVATDAIQSYRTLFRKWKKGRLGKKV